MKNGVKNNFSKKERPTYEKLFKLLDNTLRNDAENKYLESFYGVKEYVKKELKDKIWDVQLLIHATESAEILKHQGRLNGPAVKEITILMPDSDDLTKDDNR